MSRSLLTLAAVAALCLRPAAARAGDVPEDLPRLVLDSGRVVPAAAEPGLVRLQIHGEEQVRFELLRSFPLDATTTTVQRYPAGTRVVSDSLGQNYFASHWLRVTPTLQVGEKLKLVAQADLTGILAGQLAHDTFPDQTARDTINGLDGYTNVQLRWLYGEWLTPVGLLRAGQQPSHAFRQFQGPTEFPAGGLVTGLQPGPGRLVEKQQLRLPYRALAQAGDAFGSAARLAGLQQRPRFRESQPHQRLS